jgi:hypothetical protein
VRIQPAASIKETLDWIRMNGFSRKKAVRRIFDDISGKEKIILLKYEKNIP